MAPFVGRKISRGSNLFLLACLALSLEPLGGCSYSIVYPTDPNKSISEIKGRLSDAKLEHIFEVETGGDEYQDLRVGSGRPLQATRKVTIDISVSDRNGKDLGSGRSTFLYPPSKDIPSGIVDHVLYSGMYGMQVGGMRRIELQTTGCPKHADDPCKLQSLDANDAPIFYPSRDPLVFTVTLVNVCKPLIVRKSWHPPMSDPTSEVREWSCK